ncbi:H-NS family nucleoid-associated regulatory protein [Caballeronia sp. J97]|uniref:H-NS family nucleoid-associated regulatory protein n=1 Tax=Caballeronia sp. J97 TaxID=2805429 RepID=UPI002AAFEDE0|nr:H-NS family nucleoid-associated regulatory protein [Caballeronia sp. J97]
MATLGALREKIAKLEAQAEALAKKESASVIKEIHALMNKHGLTFTDIDNGNASMASGQRTSAKATSGGKPSPAPKYRDPKSGSTWSGFGRVPGWIANAKTRDAYLIVDGGASASAASKAPKKSGNYPRGPQPAKYRDPKSGAEWSGRGKAPGWLANAKDRTKFLIEGAADASASGIENTASKTSSGKRIEQKLATKSVASKKAPTKKAATKKTSAKKTASKRAPVAQSVGKESEAGIASKKTPAKKVASKKASAKSGDTPGTGADFLQANDSSDVTSAS